MCGISAWIQIIQQFESLMGTSYYNKSIAVYKGNSGKPCYITSTVATVEMRELAIDEYNLTNKDDINKFASHSLWVGACCIYFATGYDPAFIQQVLCWESDSWQKYVCELVCTYMKID